MGTEACRLIQGNFIMPYDFRVTGLDINLMDKLAIQRIVTYHYLPQAKGTPFYRGREIYCEAITDRLLGYFSWDNPESEIWDNRRKPRTNT
jgi:hypothetical protein